MSSLREKPNLADVLAAVQPGNAVRPALTPAQKQALRDPDARLAVQVVRHLLAARTASVQSGTPHDSFPLTAPVFQAIARKLGTSVGIKRSRALIRRLVTTGVLEPSDSYRQAYRRGGVSGFRVTLYRLRAVLGSALKRKRPVGRGGRVKDGRRLRWWQHPLFGDSSGLPPPGLTRVRAARMRSLDEREWGWR